jgi:hypothetical protein
MSEDKQTFTPYFFSKTVRYSTNYLLVQVIHSICIQAINIEQYMYSLIQKKPTLADKPEPKVKLMYGHHIFIQEFQDKEPQK